MLRACTKFLNSWLTILLLQIDVNILSQDVETEEMEAAVPRILEAELHAIVDESSYKNYTGDGYAKEYPYEESKHLLPWLRFSVKKSVKATPF